MLAQPLSIHTLLPTVRSVRTVKSRTWWRSMVAFVSAFTLLCLVYTAATHHHDSAIEEHDCAVCAAVVHKVSGTPTADVPLRASILLPYKAYVLAAQFVHAPVSSCITPPSCGPPSL